MSRLVTRPIASSAELIEHFDRMAPAYEDTHGHPQRLLRYRLAIIDELLGAPRVGTLLEIGCGKAIHLIGLAERCDRAIGTDASPEMVRIARRDAAASRWSDRLELRVDPGEELTTVADGSIDAVLCVGALEHMLDRPRVLAQVRRVLAEHGRFVCLTPNGDYCWYRALAPRLGLDTRHLSTDRFLTAAQVQAHARDAGLWPERLERWRFIPKGDIPPIWGGVLHCLDWAGRATGAPALRGGLALLARPAARAAR
jgi:2-polyprenyl-6-hydroxyphenyl methylase/3-demethylubiquinone-9 3-methyltransferase